MGVDTASLNSLSSDLRMLLVEQLRAAALQRQNLEIRGPQPTLEECLLLELADHREALRVLQEAAPELFGAP